MWTEPELKALKPRAKRYRITENTRERGAGRLVLEVMPDGPKVFYFQYHFGGRRRLARLGLYKDRHGKTELTLRSARAKASDYGDILKRGVDVKVRLAERATEAERAASLERARGTFEDLLKSYVQDMANDKKRTWESVENSLNRYVLQPFPNLASRKAKEIEPGDITDILARMIERGVTTHANRVRAYLHRAFHLGITREHDPRRQLRSGVKFGLESNPVASVPRQEDFERVGERWLTRDAVCSLWHALPEHTGIVMGALIKLCLATGGQRPGELIRCKWEFVDFEQELLLIPDSVSKNKLDHLVPLHPISLRILRDLQESTGHCQFLFAGGRGSSIKGDLHVRSDSVGRAVQRFCGVAGFERFQPRDLRRTAKTLMGEAGIDKVIRDRIQNHAMLDVSSKHYDRYDYLKEKRDAIAIWGAYLDCIVDPQVNVVELRRR